MRHRPAIAVAVLAAALLLGSCSTSGDDATSADPTDQGGAPGAGSTDPGGTGDGSPSTETEVTSPPAPPVRTTRSTACDSGVTPPTGVDEEIAVDGAGTPRTYLRHVPPAHDGSTPIPVVVDLHGYQEGARIHTAMSGLGPYGDTQGFVTVTPQGEGEVPRWIAETGSTDVTFIAAVLDDVESTLCVDLDRVYVTGLSNGAFMTSTLACDLSDRFAAAAPVAGIQDIEGCAPSRPVPVIAFHGTEDTFIAYDGGLGTSALALPAPDGSGRTIGDLIAEGQTGSSDGSGSLPDTAGPPVPEITAAWAARNGCQPTPTETPVTEDVTKIAFTCPGGADVELYRVAGGGHTWPGSAFSQTIESVVGPTTMSIDANALMWAFFLAHPMTAAS